MELIDREALIENVEMQLQDALHGEEVTGRAVFKQKAMDCKNFIALIKDMPTIEAVPVVHGEWIKSQSMPRSAKCSECKCWITRHSVNEMWFRYCPHCGADMRKKVKNEN